MFSNIPTKIVGALNPEKPPVDYHFMLPTYITVGVGLEKLVNKTPEVPGDIEEIKNIEYKNINGKSLQLDIYKPANHDSAWHFRPNCTNRAV